MTRPPATRLGVLLTRPLADSIRASDMIGALGFVPVIAPIMCIKPVDVALPQDVQAVLVTSGNALDAVEAWPVKLLAVGDATAGRARERGFTDVSSAGADGSALVELAARALRPDAGPVLLLSGARQGDAVAAELAECGFDVVRRVTYAAEPVAQFPQEAARALAEDTLHAAIFLSGETAAAFVRLLPRDNVPHVHGVLALAIGKAAADALKPLPWRQVRLARKPTLDDVLALL